MPLLLGTFPTLILTVYTQLVSDIFSPGTPISAGWLGHSTWVGLVHI